MKIKETIKYLKVRKKWWLLPVIIWLVLVAKFIRNVEDDDVGKKE